MRHAGRTGVTKGSCLIFFEEQSESTTMFIPINLEGSDSRGSLGVSGGLPASLLPGEAIDGAGGRDDMCGFVYVCIYWR